MHRYRRIYVEDTTDNTASFTTTTSRGGGGADGGGTTAQRAAQAAAAGVAGDRGHLAKAWASEAAGVQSRFERAGLAGHTTVQ